MKENDYYSDDAEYDTDEKGKKKKKEKEGNLKEYFVSRPLCILTALALTLDSASLHMLIGSIVCCSGPHLQVPS